MTAAPFFKKKKSTNYINRNMKKTLQTIIENAYKQWQEGIVSNQIPTINERTIQVYLAYYLLQYGKPIAEKAGYDFQVLLEVDLGEIHTCKTQGHARCDIVVYLSDGKGKCCAAIEMKRPEMKKNAKNAATTDARFAVLCDIEELEHYKADLKYEIVYTDYHIFSHSREDVKFNISQGKVLSKHNEYIKKGKTCTVNIKGKYISRWDELPATDPRHYFLKMSIK